MTCDESLERMSELLDGIPSEALEDHLGACPACREGLEGMRRADGALRRQPRLEWTPAMTEAVLRRARRPARLPWALAAAGLAVAALGIALALRKPEPPPSALADHVAAVRCLAGQEALAPEILRSQIRQLDLPALTGDLLRTPAAKPYEGYLRETARTIDAVGEKGSGWSREAAKELWGAAKNVQDACSFADAPARLVPVADPAPVDLYAEGRLRFANGDPEGAVRALDGLLGRHPDGPYADPACVALADHFARAGDDLSALAFYASIRRPETITPEVAARIRETARRAGRAFAGPKDLAGADLETLRGCASGGTPYGLVRAGPDGTTEGWLLGILPAEFRAAAAPEAACPSLEVRRARVDPARMPEAMKRLAK